MREDRQAKPSASWRRPSTPIRVGISACLLGEEVRYDGSHKRDAFLVDVLGLFVEWVPTCPEVAIGLGVPRPAIQLVRDDALRLVEPERAVDHTASMRRFARTRVRELGKQALCGYVLKQGSPSCGIHDVKIWRASGRPLRSGTGLFAQALLDAHPGLPVEEEGRLQDVELRAHFIERIFAFHRLQALFSEPWQVEELGVFHMAHEPQLRAHGEKGYRALDHLIAEARGAPRKDLRERYTRLFMQALAQSATRQGD